ncbi:putative mevalonate kinase [Rosa chinensis]|uniref:Putative mevalonate kinase n=1 Tax=Rosa chinensis TaxID=74649 RepID=A0A2P6R6T8_ROSCH|nr:putative mevalonate kinase [Rosa chinensis]
MGLWSWVICCTLCCILWCSSCLLRLCESGFQPPRAVRFWAKANLTCSINEHLKVKKSSMESHLELTTQSAHMVRNMIKFRSGSLTRLKSNMPLKMLITNTKVGRNTKVLVLQRGH